MVFKKGQPGGPGRKPRLLPIDGRTEARADGSRKLIRKVYPTDMLTPPEPVRDLLNHVFEDSP